MHTWCLLGRTLSLATSITPAHPSVPRQYTCASHGAYQHNTADDPLRQHVLHPPPVVRRPSLVMLALVYSTVVHIFRRPPNHLTCTLDCPWHGRLRYTEPPCPSWVGYSLRRYVDQCPWLTLSTLPAARPALHSSAQVGLEDQSTFCRRNSPGAGTKAIKS
ncbi:hypothetical protein B0I35DRAFT_278864 [Stachybotrys elegans]|uniref:Secreted protein n=1 Tax=Stachybotrys elegans TaxID=80388 RepID=A0A8K0WR55_9HYPO|nr:hypothetical protein B0I35DRAFT_278864 [Stachybotrys elegans]